jgi:hypothetical protein
MPGHPPNRGRLWRFGSWLIQLGKKAGKLEPPEQIAMILAVLISGGVIYENFEALFVYRPDISIWALIFDGDMAAGLFVVAIVAVGFEFWKLRSQKEPKPAEVTIRLVSDNGNISAVKAEPVPPKTDEIAEKG